MTDKAIFSTDSSINPSVQIKLQAAEQFLAKGDFAGAMALCDEVLKQSPRDAASFHMMGIIAQQRGNSELALKFIETALTEQPNFSRAWYSRSVILGTQGQAKEALHCARAAVGLAPEIGEAWDLIAQISR